MKNENSISDSECLTQIENHLNKPNYVNQKDLRAHLREVHQIKNAQLTNIGPNALQVKDLVKNYFRDSEQKLRLHKKCSSEIEFKISNELFIKVDKIYREKKVFTPKIRVKQIF